MTTYWVSVKGEEAVVHGVDMGNGSKPITIHKSLPTQLPLTQNEIDAYTKAVGHPPLLVLKVPGGKHFIARGSAWASHGTSFYVLEIAAMRDGDYLCKHIIDFDLRKGKD